MKKNRTTVLTSPYGPVLISPGGRAMPLKKSHQLGAKPFTPEKLLFRHILAAYEKSEVQVDPNCALPLPDDITLNG